MNNSTLAPNPSIKCVRCGYSTIEEIFERKSYCNTKTDILTITAANNHEPYGKEIEEVLF